MLAIETRYVGPTNYSGSRIIARVMERYRCEKARKVTVGYDDALNTGDNHMEAAKALIVKLRLDGGERLRRLDWWR